jgi:hypothetical protein
MVKYLIRSKGVGANCTCCFTKIIKCAVRSQTYAQSSFQWLFRQIGLKAVSTCGHKIASFKTTQNLCPWKNSNTIYKASSLFGHMVLSCESDRLLTYYMKSDYFNCRVLKTPYIGSADTHTRTNSEIIRRAVWTITAQKPRAARLWMSRMFRTWASFTTRAALE